MGFPDRSRLGRARLAVELLEDRTTPAKLDDLASLALPELVATGAIAGDRVNVVMNAQASSASDAAFLAATPLASSVKALGFGIYSVTLTAGTDLGAAVSFYNALSGVASAAPDEIVHLQKTPNDPSYSSLYGLNKIGAPTAWNTTTGSSSFVVAVIDTGVDYNHPDLAANMWRNSKEAADGIDNDGNGIIDDIYGADFANGDGNPLDDNNHGTHVAGTIGAVGNNSGGVAGVNWSVKIMALKFLGADGSGAISNAVSCLDYAVKNGAKVSNNSWGGGGYSTTMAAAIGRAQTAGHIFVAAAGNSAQNIDTTASYPASYIQSFNNVVTVAATDSNDALASFSNYGASSVTLAAPGVSILSTTRNNTYSSFSGTSMATPHVAGAIALYWSANPTLTYTQVIAKLKSSVDQVAGLNGKVSTGGRLNVGNMFATTSPPVAPGPKVVTAVYSGTSAMQLDKVRVTFDKAISASSFTTADIVSFNGPNGAISTNFAVTPVAGSSTQFDITFGAQTVAGSYSLTFGPNILDTTGKSMDQNGNGQFDATADRFTATGSLVLNVNRTYSATGLPLAIKDLQTTTSTLAVTESVKITDLNVKVALTHTYDSDLIITLTSPTVNGVAGKTITLFNRRGGSGDNLTNTTFDDEATIAIGSGAAPFNGSFRADALLSAFDGLNTLGTWTLKVSDNASLDTGSLTSWSLIVNGTVGNATGSAQALGFLDELPLATEAPVTLVFANEPTFTSAPAFPNQAVPARAFEFDAVPLAVASPEAISNVPSRAASDMPNGSVSGMMNALVRETTAPLTVVDDVADTSGSLSWLAPEAARSEYAGRYTAQSDEVTSYAARDTRPVTFDDFSEPHAAALATLYFPPESFSASSNNDFFGDAE